MKTSGFNIVIERDEDGRFVATCPALQGCCTEGETEQEARELILDAIRLHLEDRDLSHDLPAASDDRRLHWISQDMGPPMVDLEDKEALDESLDEKIVRGLRLSARSEKRTG